MPSLWRFPSLLYMERAAKRAPEVTAADIRGRARGPCSYYSRRADGWQEGERAHCALERANLRARSAGFAILAPIAARGGVRVVTFGVRAGCDEAAIRAQNRLEQSDIFTNFKKDCPIALFSTVCGFTTSPKQHPCNRTKKRFRTKSN